MVEFIHHFTYKTRKGEIIIKKNIRNIIVSIVVIAIAAGTFFYKRSGKDPYEDTANKINSIVKNVSDDGDEEDIVEHYIKMQPEELTYNSTPPNVYDKANKPKKYVARNLYYGESVQEKDFSEKIDVSIQDKIDKHDLGEWAYYDGGVNNLGIYNKDNIFNKGENIMLRHNLTELKINDMKITDNLDGLDEKYLNGEKDDIESIMKETIHRDEYHHNYKIATKKSGEARFKFLLVDMTVSCKSPWPVCFPVAPRLMYLDDENDHLEAVNMVYSKFVIEDGLYYMNPSMYKENDGNYYDWFLLGKGEEINLTVGYLIDITQDNPYLIIDTGCSYQCSYFSCDQHLIKVDCK